MPNAAPEHVTREKGKWENPLFELLRIDEIEISLIAKQHLKTLIAELSHLFSRDRFDLSKALF